MKFEFYLDSKKKKVQVIKAKSNEELLNIIKIAKCELTKNSLLKDLDFREIIPNIPHIIIPDLYCQDE